MEDCTGAAEKWNISLKSTANSTDTGNTVEPKARKTVRISAETEEEEDEGEETVNTSVDNTENEPTTACADPESSDDEDSVPAIRTTLTIYHMTA